MEIKKEQLPVNKNLHKKIKHLSRFGGCKLEFVCGSIFRIKETNISYLEPHRFIINTKHGIKLILLCYDNLQLYLYDKNQPVSLYQVRKIIDEINLGGK